MCAATHVAIQLLCYLSVDCCCRTPHQNPTPSSRHVAHTYLPTYRAIVAAGIMGQGMASNLAKAGAKVVVWNRSEGKRSAFVAEHEGCSAAATPKEVVESCGLTYLMLSDLEASK